MSVDTTASADRKHIEEVGEIQGGEGWLRSDRRDRKVGALTLREWVAHLREFTVSSKGPPKAMHGRTMTRVGN